VLIAERLFGQEFSIFGISDGHTVSPLEISLQDHKPLLDGDKGPNTGGMGAYAPVPIITDELYKYFRKEQTKIRNS
jgi:phosphoribosylamine--glycine ligase